jgi:hypothetical protein
MKIRNERVLVNGYFHEQGSVLRGDAEGFCDRFEVEILMDSDEPPDAVEELVRMARRLCFTEKALITQVPVEVTYKVNESPGKGKPG